MPLCVVCATPVTNTFPFMSPRARAASSRPQLSVEAPVEALGVLSLSLIVLCPCGARVSCRVHARRSLAALTRRSLGPARVGDGDVRAGLGRPGVEEDGDDDERGAAPEAVVRGEVEGARMRGTTEGSQAPIGVCDLGAISSPLREVEIAPRDHPRATATPRDAPAGCTHVLQNLTPVNHLKHPCHLLNLVRRTLDTPIGPTSPVPLGYRRHPRAAASCLPIL